MRYSIGFLLAAMLVFSGCNMVSSTVGVSTDSGMAVAVNATGDFLYSGPAQAYSENKRALLLFLDKEYGQAREIFTATLKQFPDNPDTVYYLGLTLIYQGEREAGFTMLGQYRDTYMNRVAQEVRWWAAYCRKKPDLTPEKIHQVMNKARADGYQRQQEEEWEDRWM